MTWENISPVAVASVSPFLRSWKRRVYWMLLSPFMVAAGEILRIS